MRTCIGVGAAVAAALLPFAAAAQGSPASSGLLPDDVSVTVGARVWHTRWTTWLSPEAVVSYFPARIEPTITPVVSVRYQRFFVSGSYLVDKTFHFLEDSPLLLGQDRLSFKRNEYDVNFGYFLMPGLAVTVGWKNVNYEGDPGDYRFVAKGPTIGLSGNAAISPAVSLYGNLAYGRPKLHDYGGVYEKEKGKYLLTEFGLAFPLGSVHSSMSRVVATAGYRYQRVSGYPNATELQTQLFEYAQGPVVGLSYTF
jgi:hypothetical protein